MPPVAAKQKGQKLFWAMLFAALFGLGLFVSLPPAPSTATELLQDGGFESGSTAFWTPSPGTTIFTLTTSPVHSGTWAASVGSNSNSTKAIIQNIIGITAENRYILSGYAYKNDPNGITFTLRLRVAWYAAADCSGSQLATVDSNELTTDQPEFVFLTTGIITAPSSVRCAQVRAQVAPRAGYSATAYFDDLTLAIAPEPPPTVTPTLTVTPTPTASPTPTATPTPPPAPVEGVIINEVAWSGAAASSSDEWIELYNAATQTVKLDGWDITGALNVSLSGVISPGGYFLLERSDDNTVSDIPADLIYTGGLNNDGESLFLGNGFYRVDSANANGGAWPGGSAAPDYESMERLDPRAPPNDANWRSNDRLHRNGLDADGNPLNGTPKQANSTTYPPPPPPVYLPLNLSELLPDPGGTDWDGDGEANSKDEWIELFNPNPESANLSGWFLRDAAGTSYTFPAEATIAAGQYLAVYRRVTGIALNNDGDTAALYRPDGLLSDQIVYSSNPGDDITICRHPDTGALHTFCLPTPNAANIVLPDPGPLSLSIYDAKHVTEGAWVKVRGYVTVSPGVFGKNVMYIQDDTHGIRLKLPSRHNLWFELGAHLEATGYLDLYYNEWEIDIKSKSDVRRLDGFKLVPPLPVDAGMLREGYEGLLVQLTVTPVAFKKSASHFWVEDATGLAYVYVYRKSGIRRKTLTLGLPTTIVGIAGQRTRSQPPLDGYRLYPRAPFDITQYPFPAPPPANWPTLLPETGGGRF